MSFWRRNLAFSRLAIMTNLEYRFNYFIDALAQPLLTSAVEVTLWTALFAGATQTIGGFTKEYYLAYVIWGAFVARITVSWMYEYRMIEEIDSGSINGLLVRPMSFFEYYLSQLMGYKLVTTAISLVAPAAAILIFKLPTDFSRVPLALLLVTYYLFLVHTLGFLVATFAFRLNRVHSFIVAKNLALWLLSGELIPIDLLPETYKNILLALPFCNAVYVPVGYITGRIDVSVVYQGFASVTIGILVLGVMARISWVRGLKKYAGTGA